MQEIKKGLFLVEEEMPCPPYKVIISKYFLTGTPSKNGEEAAARIISFSQELGQWVGVSWKTLVEMMEEDLKNQATLQKSSNYHQEQIQIWFESCNYHSIVNFFTMGIWGLFVSKPPCPVKKAENVRAPHSGIYKYGLKYVFVGIQELLEGGMLKQVTEVKGAGDGIHIVFFPTPALISKIMEKQGVIVKRD